MTEADFAALPYRAQVHRLREVARAALRDYDLEVTRLRLLLHEFNTSFRVDTADGRRYAMRINVHSRKDDAHLDAELAWLTALSARTDLAVPVPLPTRGGALRTVAPCAALDRDLPVVVMSWLPGRDVDDVPPHDARDATRALGGAMAQLHTHAATWVPPPPARLPDPHDVLLGEPSRLADPHPALDAAGGRAAHDVLERAHALAEAAFATDRARGPVHPVHGDLHGGNAKWYRRRIAVFDFDDAATATPGHDRAVAIYYLRDHDSLERDFDAGYVETAGAAASSGDPDELEALLAGRNLSLLNYVLGGAGGFDDAFAAWYARNTVTKLRAYLDSGEYHHDVPGLVPK